MAEGPYVLFRQKKGPDCYENPNGEFEVDVTGGASNVGNVCCYAVYEDDNFNIADTTWDPDYGDYGRMEITWDPGSITCGVRCTPDGCWSSPPDYCEFRLSPDGATLGSKADIPTGATGTQTTYIEATSDDLGDTGATEHRGEDIKIMQGAEDTKSYSPEELGQNVLVSLAAMEGIVYSESSAESLVLDCGVDDNITYSESLGIAVVIEQSLTDHQTGRNIKTKVGGEWVHSPSKILIAGSWAEAPLQVTGA